MEQLLRIILPSYFIVYFGIAFVAKSLMVAKRIGKNPLVLPKDDSVYGLIGRYFKLTLIFMFVYVLLFAFVPTLYSTFLPITQLDTLTLKYIGLGLLAFALSWTIIAQGHMKNSWRIGIALKTDVLIETIWPVPALTAPNKLTLFLVGACNKTGSFSSGGIHILQRVPCC